MHLHVSLYTVGVGVSQSCLGVKCGGVVLVPGAGGRRDVSTGSLGMMLPCVYVVPFGHGLVPSV